MKILIGIIIFLCCVASTIVSWIWLLCATAVGSPRAINIAIGFDQLANAAFGGDPDETVSSRAARAQRAGRRWGCVLCKCLDKLDPGHCDRNLETRFLK